MYVCMYMCMYVPSSMYVYCDNCRDTVLERLAQQDVGSFVVRDSTTHAGCYALSIRVDSADQIISHYLITRTPRGTIRLKVCAITR